VTSYAMDFALYVESSSSSGQMSICLSYYVCARWCWQAEVDRNLQYEKMRMAGRKIWLIFGLAELSRKPKKFG